MFRKILSIGLALFLIVDEPVPAIAQSANPVVVNPLPTLVNGQAYPLVLDTSGRLVTTVNGTTTVAGSGTFTVQSQTTGSNTTATKVISTAAVAGSLATSANQPVYGWQVTSGASAGFVLILEGTSLAADGAVVPNECYVLAANSTFVRDYGMFPQRPFSASDNQYIVFSTTGCYTKTISATAFIGYRF